MDELAVYLKDNAERIAADVIHDWGVLGKSEPWRRVPEGLGQDHLPDMIRGLADVALSSFFTEDRRREVVRVAAQHGEHRFQQGASEEILSREYELLRWSLWRRLKDRTTAHDASQAIIRLDSALTLAHGASLRGYHRGHIEGKGDWPQALERYLDEWSFPT
jgi:hypothetical protein